MSERQEAIAKLRGESRDFEEKLREALSSAQHRGEALKQMKDDFKHANAKVGHLEKTATHIC